MSEGDAARFPDTPAGRYAAECGGRCPAHGAPLEVAPGYALHIEFFPSREWEAFRMANPFSLDLGRSLTPPARSCSRETLVWCPRCEAARRRGEPVLK